MAAGKVRTGFSKPYVALYANNGTSVTYTGCRRLARGVEVDVSPETGGDNNFYADNVAAESSPGKFTSGTLTLTVDGLLSESEQFIYGLPDPETMTVDEREVKIYKHGENISIPYVGVGYVVRYQSEGIVTYVPTVLRKAKFNAAGEEAATQEEDIEYQTQQLTAALSRDDTLSHDWKYVGEDLATEEEAEAVIIAILGGVTEAA